MEAAHSVAPRTILPNEDEILHVANLELRPHSAELLVEANRVPFTLREFENFWVMVQRPGRVLTRPEIYALVWRETMSYRNRSVDVFVRKILRSSAWRRPSGSTFTPTPESATAFPKSPRHAVGRRRNGSAGGLAVSVSRRDAIGRCQLCHSHDSPDVDERVKNDYCRASVSGCDASVNSRNRPLITNAICSPISTVWSPIRSM